MDSVKSFRDYSDRWHIEFARYAHTHAHMPHASACARDARYLRTMRDPSRVLVMTITLLAQHLMGLGVRVVRV